MSGMYPRGAKPKKRSRYKMTSFKISEISGVDKPAQEPATVAIMKRDDEQAELAKHGLLTSSADGHQHLYDADVQSGCSSSAPSSSGMWHAHPYVFDEDGMVTIGEAAGHIHLGHGAGEAAAPEEAAPGEAAKRQFGAESRRELAESGAAMADGSYPISNGGDLKNAIRSWGRAKESERAAVARHIKSRAKKLGLADQLPTSGPLAEAMGTAKNQETDMTTEIEALQKKLDEQTAISKSLASVVALSTTQRARHDALDLPDQLAFLAKSSLDRDAEVTKALEADPVVATIEGRDVRKSQDPTGAIAALAKQAAADRVRVATAEAGTAQLALEKRADLEIPKLPGDVAVRSAILKAIDGIADEPTRKAAHAAVKAGSAAIASGMAKIGHDGGTLEGSPEARLDTLAKARATADKVSYAKAYDLNLDDNQEARQIMADLNRARMTSVPR